MSDTCRRIFLTAVLAGSLGGNVFAQETVKNVVSETKPQNNPLPAVQNPVTAGTKTPLPQKTMPGPASLQKMPAVMTKREAVTPVPVPAEKTIEYAVPCLTVYADDTHGKISYMPLKFTRTQADKPLRVMIIDDTPGGSGQEMHSSVWLAAVTAAMLRNDTMHGVTISVEFKGNVDGPSAGGVTCLAILSAMDGLPLPKDFAMTGTILPDGTIGVVGGVPEKMRAAAKAGVKRIFIPAFLRIFKDSKGKDVDLSRLADELKVELHRVENISEAYAILHNKPYHEGEYVNVRNMTKLSREVEDVLLPVYQDYFKKVSEKIKAQPKRKRNYILDNYVLSPELAQDYYQEGKLLPATLQIFHSWQAWQAWEKADAYIGAFFKEKDPGLKNIIYLREYHLRKLLAALKESVDKLGVSLAEEQQKNSLEYFKKLLPGEDPQKVHGYVPFLNGLSEITAQLEPVACEPTLLGNIGALAAARESAEKMNESSEKELESQIETEMAILRLLYLAAADENALSDFLGKLGKVLPQLHANKQAADVEWLFSSAACAASSVAGQNLQSTVTAMADSGHKTEIENEIIRNPFFCTMLEMKKQAQYMHNLLQADSEKQPYDPVYHL